MSPFGPLQNTKQSHKHVHEHKFKSTTQLASYYSLCNRAHSRKQLFKMSLKNHLRLLADKIGGRRVNLFQFRLSQRIAEATVQYSVHAIHKVTDTIDVHEDTITKVSS